MSIECPYTLQWDDPFPSKLPVPMGGSGTHLIRGSLGPAESSTQTASGLVQPFLQGSLVWQTDRQTDRPTDRPRYSVGNNRPHLRCNLKMENGHPVEDPFGREFSSIYIARELQRPEVASRWKFWPKICIFWKEQPFMGKFSKFCSERIHHLTDPRLVCKFREIWLTGNR